MGIFCQSQKLVGIFATGGDFSTGGNFDDSARRPLRWDWWGFSGGDFLSVSKTGGDFRKSPPDLVRILH